MIIKDSCAAIDIVVDDKAGTIQLTRNTLDEHITISIPLWEDIKNTTDRMVKMLWKDNA